MHAARFCALALLCVSAASAQPERTSDLAVAYKLLAQKDYDGAIAAFRQSLAAEPKNAAAHKDLAYTFLKAGENQHARDDSKPRSISTRTTKHRLSSTPSSATKPTKK